MTVQIKPLKGFKNYINGENNTLSLLIKSDCELQEHLSNAREKLLTSLTSIIDHYNSNSNHEVYFYHKLQVLNGRRTDYLKTRAYKTKLDSIKIDLKASIENLLSIAHSEFVSHFVNITILLYDEALELSNDKFSKLNWIIRSKLSKINSEEHDFVDENNECPFVNNKSSLYEDQLEKTKASLFIDENDEGQFEKPKASLFIDENDEGQFEKPKTSLFIDENDEGQFEKPKASLFIDNNYEDPFEKALMNARNIDLRLKRNIKITNKKFINFLEAYVLP